jgi:hypothetical protein
VVAVGIRSTLLKVCSEGVTDQKLGG